MANNGVFIGGRKHDPEKRIGWRSTGANMREPIHVQGTVNRMRTPEGAPRAEGMNQSFRQATGEARAAGGTVENVTGTTNGFAFASRSAANPAGGDIGQAKEYMRAGGSFNDRDGDGIPDGAEVTRTVKEPVGEGGSQATTVAKFIQKRPQKRSDEQIRQGLGSRDRLKLFDAENSKTTAKQDYAQSVMEGGRAEDQGAIDAFERDADRQNQLDVADRQFVTPAQLKADAAKAVAGTQAGAAMSVAGTQAGAQTAVADTQAGAATEVATTQAGAAMGVADKQAGAMKHGADAQAGAIKHGADRTAEASKHRTDAEAATESAKLTEMGRQFNAKQGEEPKPWKHNGQKFITYNGQTMKMGHPDKMGATPVKDLESGELIGVQQADGTFKFDPKRMGGGTSKKGKGVSSLDDALSGV